MNFPSSYKEPDTSVSKQMALQQFKGASGAGNAYTAIADYFFDTAMVDYKAESLNKYKTMDDARAEEYKIAGEDRKRAGLMDETTPEGMEFASKRKKANLELKKLEKEINKKPKPHDMTKLQEKEWDLLLTDYEYLKDNPPEEGSGPKYDAWLAKVDKIRLKLQTIGQSQEGRQAVMKEWQAGQPKVAPTPTTSTGSKEYSETVLGNVKDDIVGLFSGGSSDEEAPSTISRAPTTRGQAGRVSSQELIAQKVSRAKQAIANLEGKLESGRFRRGERENTIRRLEQLKAELKQLQQ